MSKDNIFPGLGGCPLDFRQSMELCSKLLDSITDHGALLCDAEGTILYYNETASLHDHLSKENVIGKNYREIYFDDDGGCVAQALKTKQPVRNKITKFWNDQNVLKVCVDNAYPIWSEGELIGIFVLTKYPDHVAHRLSETIADSSQSQLLGDRMNQGCSNVLRKYSKFGATYEFTDIPGQNKAFLEAVKQAKEAAFRVSPVILTAEYGCETDQFAQSIHNASLLRTKPFITVRCSTLSEEQMEEVLFGNGKDFAGVIKTVNDKQIEGTLFLDGIQNLTRRVQLELLKMQKKKAGDRSRLKNISEGDRVFPSWRIISSCNQPLLDCIKNNILEEELVFTLAEIHIDIPPLRYRKEDIGLLARQFVRTHVFKTEKITEEVAKALQTYSWPENIDELHRTLEEAILLKDPEETLAPKHFDAVFKAPFGKHLLPTATKDLNAGKEVLKAVQKEATKEVIEKALERNGFNITKTAQELGVSRSNLQYHIRKLGIEIPKK